MTINSSPDTEFRIISQTFDSWNVQFRIDVAELLDQQGLLRHLRRIKHQIADIQSVPESCLMFDGIIRKTRTEDSVDVVVRIKKIIVEKGNPRVRFKEGIGADESHYSHMTALLDIYYLDQFEKPIMLDRVLQTIRESRVAADLIDNAMLIRKVQEALDKQFPIKNTVIAKGEFPDIGTDAMLDFYFQAMVEAGKTDHYYSSRRVKRGDILCRKTPPQPGKKPGRNVLGEMLPTRIGLDIEMRAGAGAELSLDETEILADNDGVVVVDRTMQRVSLVGGSKEIPRFIEIKVNPVLRIEGNQILDIATSQAVEIVGNLTMGSRILTDCDVYVSGNVEEGVFIQAARDVYVDGDVAGATIQSETNVVAQKNVTNSDLQARDKIIIKGTLRNSTATADSISVDAIAGSRLIANNSVAINAVIADENNILSSICVGMQEFFQQRIHDNSVFIERARGNLSRIETLLGSDLVRDVDAHNIQIMLMRFLAQHRMGQDYASRKQVEVFRKLLESVPPTRVLIEQKEKESLRLINQLKSSDMSDNGVVVIREKLTARTLIAVNGTEAEIESLPGSSSIRADGTGNLVVDRYSDAVSGAGMRSTGDEE
jgi:hypothetical protein